MNMVIFKDWLMKLNNRFKNKDRKILLLVDNAGGHNLAGTHFSNITIEYLPPNTTSQIQPLDAGIIKIFKANYLNNLTDNYCEQVDDIKELNKGIKMK